MSSPLPPSLQRTDAPWSNRTPVPGNILKQLDQSLANDVPVLRAIISKLETEVAQCRKREQAIRDVFIQNQEKEQELSKWQRSYEKQAVDLKQAEVRLGIERRKLNREKAVLRIRDKEQQKMLDSNQAKKEGVGLKANHQNTKVNIIDNRVFHEYPYTHIFEAGRTEQNFMIDHNHNTKDFKKHKLPSLDVAHHSVLELLRRHEYYRGWLDCVKATEKAEFVDNCYLPASRLPDVNDEMSLMCAGANVGANFAWSALCKSRNKPEWNISLDSREWKISDLRQENVDAGKKSAFWIGVERGRLRAEKRFRERVNEEAVGPEWDGYGPMTMTQLGRHHTDDYRGEFPTLLEANPSTVGTSKWELRFGRDDTTNAS
ncbi:hypothetical protein CC80DRAFT_547021 [Byssothecium circinans]|uniref:Uncharacterized protein n=1 Tax=Byssothecium circinans TaxID=147558 RepID=A0A6A5TZC1_9PLEO|nr:hypothetical protein CC80DRAFT_547021 [Byssothecium circinans]